MPSSASGDSFTVDPNVVGTLGANGWYVSTVHVTWTIAPLGYISATGCNPTTVSNDGVTNFDCIVKWTGATLERTFAVNVDKKAPAVHGVLSRPPDANGWYNKPVTIAFAGTDATSGIAGCSSATYNGPATTNAVVSGTCTDRAGNVGRSTVHLAYDSTPPPPCGSVKVKHADKAVLLSWKTSADTKTVQVTRSGPKQAPKLVFSGSGGSYMDRGLRPGAKYKYTLTAFDAASNSSTAETVGVTATGRLIEPFPGESVTSPLRLFWVPVKNASYYNVQLIKGHRVLSAWPARSSFKVPRSWKYHGHHYRLRHGVYRWYVWPGYGKRARAKYGRLIGGSSFRYSG